MQYVIRTVPIYQYYVNPYHSYIIIDGSLLKHFEFFTAVLIWKSQSPWPTLRRALYDYYLAYTGSYAGVSNGLTTITIYSKHNNVDNNNTNNKKKNKEYEMKNNNEKTNSDDNICDDSNNTTNQLGMKTTSSLPIIFNPQTRQISLIHLSMLKFFYSDTFFIINKGVVPGYN